MKVKDLIMKLIYCDPEAEIKARTYKSDSRHAEVYNLCIKDVGNYPKNVDLILDDLNHIKFSENTIFEELVEKVLEWAKDKDLLHEENAERQFMKFMEEVFEFKTEMDHFARIGQSSENVHCDYEKLIEAQDNARFEMGDIFVTLIILCDQLSLEPVECLFQAYDKIKDRKGKTIDGTFIKEGDLR